eukprot:s1576_g17.t1
MQEVCGGQVNVRLQIQPFIWLLQSTTMRKLCDREEKVVPGSARVSDSDFKEQMLRLYFGSAGTCEGTATDKVARRIAMQPQALLTALPLFVIVRHSLFQDTLSKKDLATPSFTPQVSAPFMPESKEEAIDGLMEGQFENATICKMVDLNHSAKTISECNFTLT